MTASALRALTAAAIAQQDMVARRNPGHPRTDRLDHACALVPENGGRVTRRVGAGGREEIRVAHTAGHEPDEHLSCTGLGQLELLHLERRPERLEHGGADLHAAILR